MKRWTRIPNALYYADLTGTIDLVIEKLEGLRAEYGPDVFIDIDIEDNEYGDGKHIVTELKRPETDEEYKARLEKENAEADARKEYRRKMFESLKQEFGDQ